MKIYTRADWGARPFRTPRRHVPLSKRREVTIHYPGAGTPPRDYKGYAKWIERIHMDQNGWSGVGYNYFVDAYGNVAEGCGRDIQGAHSPPHNYDGIGINIWTSNGVPTEAGKRAARELYDQLCRQAGRKLRIGWHGRDFATACPGPNLISWAKAGMPVSGSAPAPSTGATAPATTEWEAMMANLSSIKTDSDLKKLIIDAVRGDRYPAPPAALKSDPKNKNWTLDTYLKWTYENAAAAKTAARRSISAAAALEAKVDALAKKSGMSDAELKAITAAAKAGAEKALDEMIDEATVSLEVK